MRHVKTCYEAIEFAKSNETAVVICERDLPDGDWTAVFAECETLPRHPNVIVTAAISDEALWAEVLNLGGYDVLAQAFDSIEVFSSGLLGLAAVERRIVDWRLPRCS